MKKIFYSTVALLAMGAALTGCSDDFSPNLGGEGVVYLKTKVSTDVKVISRAAAENAELAAQTTIWISGSKGAVRKYNGIDEVPADGIRLVAGNYVAEAWTGDSVAASFDKRWFKGREEFTITDNSRTQVELVCYIANSVVSLTYEDGVADVLTDCKFEIGHNGGKLTFDETTPADAKGYFMMSSYDKDLTYTLTGTRVDGKGTFTKTGVIKDAKPTTEYAIHVKHDGTVVEPIGGAFITIEVDETPLAEITDTFELTAAPLIKGIGFDIDKPIVGSEGAVDGHSIWVAGTVNLSDVDVTCPELMSALGLTGDGFELFHVTDQFKASLNAAGVSWINFTHEDSDYQEVKLIFSDAALSRLPKGDNQIVIAAKDADGRISSATMTVKITDAQVETVPVADGALSTYATSATVSGRILKDGVTRAGFKYAPAGTSNWQTVWAAAPAAGYSVGDEFSAELTGLTPATRYEVRAIADDAEAPAVTTFTTEAAFPVENAGFAGWRTDGNGVQRLYASGASTFWDSGNEGAKKAGAVLTTPDSSIKHSGNYSAKLESKKASIMGIGKFAAGNAFIGQYLKTDGMDGILGWGRPFTGRPKAMKIWVRYRNGAVDEIGKDDGGASGFSKGDMDKGIIYIALCDNSKMTVDSYSWPCIVQTKTAKRHLFSKNDANVLAYGEKIFDGNVGPDNGLVEIEIPITYNRTDVRPSNIMIVASASKGGDYYTGSTSSVMHIDDIELVY